MTRNAPAAVSARQARISLSLPLAINLFNYVDRSILYSVQETVRLQFGVSSSAVGWLVLAFLVTYMLLSPVFGWLADRYSRWMLIGIGVALWSLASGAFGLAILRRAARHKMPHRRRRSRLRTGRSDIDF